MNQRLSWGAFALLSLGALALVIGLGPEDPVAEEDITPVKSLVRVDVTRPESVIALKRALRSWDRAGSVDPGRSLDLVVTPAERRALESAGVPFNVVIEDVEANQARSRATYHTFPQMEAILANLATSYPNITALSSIGQSVEGRDVWALEISDQPGQDEGEVGVVYMGLHHAREWPSLEFCLELATRLTAGYGVDPTLTTLINNRRVWIVPCVNPDGYVYSHDQGNDWRKNRRYFPQFGTYGVDLNRNYPGSANGDPDGSWGSVGDGSQSHNPGQEVFCGPSAFSEPETQVIRDFCNAHDFSILITYHTYSELVLWPWGYNGAVQADDDALLTSIGQGMAAQITKQSGSGTYAPSQASGLYPTTGDTTEWVYGYRYYRLGKNTLAYTVEMCSQFQPPTSTLQQVLDENYDGALYILQQAASAASQMTPWVLPPVLSVPPTDGDGNFTVSWTQANPTAGANRYALQELTGLSRRTDGAEAGTASWQLDQFSSSTARAYAGNRSFKSPSGDEIIAAMTTTEPLPVEAGDTLSFWIWHAIEQDWDMGFVEVSTDGLYFEVLDRFTGFSSGWEPKTYSLADYVGDSIYLRFRYTTDAYVVEEGFYVDDIHPVASWSSMTTLDDDITATSYAISGKPDGDYAYRVSGSNPERGFGAYSGVQWVTVAPTACPGDTNCDGQIDFDDINAFVEAVVNGVYCDGTGANADLTQDDPPTVDFDDINPFVVLLTTNPLPIACP